jgi:hypothetical protein
MPLDLTDDRGGRVGRELHATLRVEPIDGFDQADGGDLHQVVQRLATVAETPCKVLDERQMHLDELLAYGHPLGRALLNRGKPVEEISGSCPVVAVARPRVELVGHSSPVAPRFLVMVMPTRLL